MDNRPIEPGRSVQNYTQLPENDRKEEGSHNSRAIRTTDKPNQIPTTGNKAPPPPKPRKASHIRTMSLLLKQLPQENGTKGVQWLKGIAERSEVDLLRLFIVEDC